MSDVLYLSADGALKSLGFSQVVRPIVELARRGLGHSLVTLEHEADLADTARVEQVRRHLGDAGVAWSFARFRTNMGPRGPLYNYSGIARLAFAEARRARPGVVHARAFPVCSAAYMLHRTLGLPYVFDNRGYWVDQRVHGAAPLRAARLAEAEFYRRAAAAVSLTEIGARAVRNGQFGQLAAGAPSVCITTCADFDEFTLQGVAPLPAGTDARLRDKLVLGFIGSVNRDYLVPEAMRLFRFLHELRKDTVLVCITEQGRAVGDAAAREGVPSDALLVTRVNHEDMPAWLRRIDWGLLLLEERADKGGSMPTKLGEMFAAGVRPIQLGCNDEVRDWVVRTGSGITLPNASDDSLREAAAKVARAGDDPAVLLKARELAEPHFALRAGVDRYEELLRGVIAKRA